MTIIAGRELKDLAQSVIESPVELHFAHDSVDVTVDNWVRREKVTDAWSRDVWLGKDKLDDVFGPPTSPDTIVIRRKEFVQLRLEQVITMPHDKTGLFMLRSCWAQMGLEQSSSLILRAGWKGQLILEITNMTNHHDFILDPGTRIGQIVFFDATDVDALLSWNNFEDRAYP